MSKKSSNATGTPSMLNKRARTPIVPARKPPPTDKQVKRTFRDPKMRELFGPVESGLSN